MPLSHKITKFHKDLNISTMILSESLCLGVFVAEKDLSEWTHNLYLKPIGKVMRLYSFIHFDW